MSHPERITGQYELRPERECLTPDGEYRWFIYSAKDLGMTLVCLEDCKTGIVVSTPIANPNIRVAAHKAWAGARQSRAAGTPWEIRHEMGMKGVDPDAKLEETFQGYGHRSVGDMARIQVDFARVPMHLPFVFFNLGTINSGQEKSSRYQQRFGQASLHPIRHYLSEGVPAGELSGVEAAYQRLGEMALLFFTRHRHELSETFQEYYRPGPKEQGSLNSRVLDCVRYFLLFGQSTGFSFETSARDWSRIISDIKSSPLPLYRRVAGQVERLLTPTPEEEEYLGYRAEAPSLIRHTEADTTTNQNLAALRAFIETTSLLSTVGVDRQLKNDAVGQGVELVSGKYTEGEKIVVQYLLSIWPGLERAALFEWVHARNLEVKREISKIIFSGHNSYKEPPLLARATGTTLIFRSFLGEVRDFNRHRAWGRFVPLPLVHGLPLDKDTACQILARGFGLPLYLTEVPQFSGLKERFEDDLLLYYTELYEFMQGVERNLGPTDYSFIVNLLPLAHQIDIWMHGNPKQALYFTHQRVRPGGHINYRTFAYDANQLIADSDSYLSGMRLGKRPDPASREEFFDRS